MRVKTHLNDLALDILRDRYLWKNSKEETIETPSDMFRRVAHCVAGAEKPEDREHWEEVFYTVMSDLDFLPNSPTLMNAGREAPYGQLSACFVVGIEDSMASICEALRKQMLIHKSGGGTGFNFSKLRPEGATVNSTNGKASGPVSFMRLFDLSTEVVQQGGMRRGANMAILNCDHPDIRKFIHCKDKDGNITNFNLSVGLTDKFMERAVGVLDSPERALLYEIAESAWKTGDPGVVFLDTMERDNPTPSLGKLEATNPCGEQPLLPNEACNLGSINLVNMLDDNGDGTYSFNSQRFYETIRIATRFLYDVIDVNQYPLPEIEEAVKKTRKIGLGVMGLAHCYYYLGMEYGSEEAIRFFMNVMRCLWCLSREVFETMPDRPEPVAFTCIAPTGTLSLIAGVSSGIEPVFSLHHVRTVTDTAGMSHQCDVYDPAYEVLMNNKKWLARFNDEELKKIFKTSYTVPWKAHIDTQAIAQDWSDAGVSKTVNLPNWTTVDDVFNIYKYAWKEGCKGTTIYRDGSKFSQVLKCPECETF